MGQCCHVLCLVYTIEVETKLGNIVLSYAHMQIFMNEHNPPTRGPRQVKGPMDTLSVFIMSLGWRGRSKEAESDQEVMNEKQGLWIFYSFLLHKAHSALSKSYPSQLLSDNRLVNERYSDLFPFK